MKIYALLLLSFTIPNPAWSGEPNPSEATKHFEQCSKGRFIPFPTATAVSGPMVAMEGGGEVHSAVLRYQGEVIAKEGIGAFDAAFRHLDDERVHMRWIAVDVLGRISGKKPLWYFFGKPGRVFNGDPDWSDRAKKEWVVWKARQDAARKAPEPAGRLIR